MFVLEDDYYFITIKLLSIFKALECDKKPFADYRKLGLIYELIKDLNNMRLFYRLTGDENNNISDNEKALKISCDFRLDIAVIKRVLFFLEKQNIIELKKNIITGNIDVMLLKNEGLEELLRQDLFKEDIERAQEVKKAVRGLRNLKLETLQAKIFGNLEVAKWEI
jgi:predicted lactoylglutathione lyase